ncbi:MAG: hypothetical protein JWR01_1340, partial [Subtercola sp.]|nr:hypothetical protein [Subtercola sp.]
MTDDSTLRYRLDFADAGFAITNNEFDDDHHRGLLRLVAAEEITADEAVAASCERHG